MKKILPIIATLCFTGCTASTESMQKQIDQLGSQVVSLEAEKEKLTTEGEEQEKRFKLLCGLFGEESSVSAITGRPQALYVGADTFQNPITYEIVVYEDMVGRCSDMVSQYSSVVRMRSKEMLESKPDIK